MARQCSLRIVKDGRPLYGTAAQLHKIKVEGGWDSYHKKLIQSITEKVTHEVLNELNRPILKLKKKLPS